MHGGWRHYDRTVQRDLEKARQEGPEAYEEAQKRANAFYATAGGGQAGVLVGGIIGTFFGPGPGTMIGAAIGGAVGALIGHNSSK